MFDVPVNSTLTCKQYFNSLDIPKFLALYAIQTCMENLEEGRGGGFGVDLFITSVANDYFQRSSQIMVMYDESWDITDMLVRLERTTLKSFVTYYLPNDDTMSVHADTRPPDHITHKLLPKGTAFIIFIQDESAFFNILGTMGRYPWWNKRARFLIMVKEKALEPTKGILQMLEDQMIFNGVVVTEFAARLDNTTDTSGKGESSGGSDSHTNATEVVTSSGAELQVVALDPYPAPGHSKQSFVARWRGDNYTSLVRPIFEEKIENLRGNKLMACVFEFPPLVIRRELSGGKHTYWGQEVRIFQEFASILNFTFEFYEPLNGSKWGLDIGNNTWTGLIGETQRTADFGFASIFLLDNRERAVDVSNPYDQDQGCFAVPRPENLQTWVGLILPFSWQVWACIFAMAFVAGPIFSFITRPLKMDKTMSIGRGMFYAMGSLVSTQKAPDAKSHSLRTFIIVWLVFCWLAYILYRVSLIVSLTAGSSSFKLDTLLQLLDAGLDWGGFIEVLKTYSNTTKKTDKEMVERYMELANITAGLERVAVKGDFAVLDSAKYLQYAAKGIFFDGYSSAFHVMKECPTRYNVGFAMPIGSPFLDKINELISRFQSAGLIDKWLDDILHEVILKNPSRALAKRRENALSMNNMRMLVIIFFGGHFLAFLTLCGENAVVEWQKRKKEILRIARKMSIISSTTPSILITPEQDHHDDKPHHNCTSETDIIQNADDEGKLHPLPPGVEETIVFPFNDKEEVDDDEGNGVTGILGKF